MNGVTKVIDELGTMLIAKELEIETKRVEIEDLKRRVELLEGYLDVYDKFYNKS